MFMFKASVYLQELENIILRLLKVPKTRLLTAKNDLDFVRLDKSSFEQSPEDSIDYAVMEKPTKLSLYH